MAWLQDLPIRRKLTLVILLACTAVLLVACAALAAYEVFDFRRAMARDTLVLADILGKNTRAALAFQDETAAQDVLQALQSEPHVVAARLYTRDGDAFADYVRSGSSSSAVLPSRPGGDGHRFEPGGLQVFHPVVLNAKRIGTIALQVGLEGLHARLRLFGGMSALILCAALLMALGLSARLQRPISGPILALAATASAIAERKDYSLRAIRQGRNEFGLLTDAFNDMVAGIQERERALHAANEALREKITERDRAELQRKEAEASVQRSEARYSTLFDTLIEGFCTIEMIFDDAGKPVDYRFLEINPAFEKQTGLRNAQGRSMREIAPNHEAHWFELYGKIALTGESLHFENEAKALGRHFDVCAYRIGGPGSRKVAILFNDITERKAAEARAQAQITRLDLLNRITRAIAERQDLQSIYQVVIRSVEESLPVDFVCVCLYDPEANVIIVTSVGTGSAELVMSLAMTPNARIDIDQNGLARCVRGHLVYERDLGEVRFPFPQRLAHGGLRALVAAPLLVESTVFGVLLAARRPPDSFSSGECEFLKQLSEHVALAVHQTRLYGALQQAYDDLRRSQQTLLQQERLRALGQMASGIAHDINNAISPVTLYTEFLLETEPGLSARTREYLTIIQNSMDDVAQTVSRMREFYRQRQPQISLVAVDLNHLLPQVVNLTRGRWSDMPQKNGIFIDLRTEPAPGLPNIRGVESEIREALTNLIFNAVDAMPNGGTLTLRTRRPSAPATAEADGAANHPHVALEVTDTGIGMDDDTRRRCLEPFFTTKGERGTGLGLAMVYGTIQRHNAKIEIDSAPGRGTTFRLLFPIPAAAPDPHSTVVPPAAMPGRLKLLIVDDDPLIIKSLRETLESDGHDVTAANGGQAGIDAFRAALKTSSPFSLVITDLGMPHIDGRKVAGAIKEASPATPIIMLTGWGERMIAEGEIPPHVDRVLGKPPKLRDLRATLAQLSNPAP